jgi:NADPH:quinone reductase-like Zn-dependent oxidoreductase
MKLRNKILSGVAIVIAALGLSLAILLSHDSPCVTPAALAAGVPAMQAIVHRCYGSAEVLRSESIAKPTPADDELLVRVQAASVNPLDWHYVRGTPYLVRMDSGLGKPDNPRLGVDFAGTVEAVGRSVTRFKPGDEVFGGRNGAFAQYLVVRESRAVTLKPAGVSFEQAAAVPIAGITALQALRDTGGLHSGQKVLIIGASGGVGTFAVQIARFLGAEVTGVCSTRNLEMVRGLGAGQVIDYTQADFLNSGQHYDLIMDNVGNRSLSQLLALRRILTPTGRVVLIGGGGPQAGNWIGPLGTLLDALLISPFVSQKFEMLFADLKAEDLATIAGLMQSGKVTAVIDRHYPLGELPAALTYLEQGHARGKVIIDVPQGGS